MISSSERHVVTAIVDEDQLSLAIGRNGQNVRLASQLIGWQIDLYSSRDWMSRGAETALFGGGDEYEVADFPLSELEGVTPATLAALEAAGINTFFDILDMERDDFLAVPGIGEEDADLLEALIDPAAYVPLDFSRRRAGGRHEGVQCVGDARRGRGRGGRLVGGRGCGRRAVRRGGRG